MSVHFTSNFNEGEFRRKLERAAAESAKQQVQERVRRALCPVHHRPATVTFTGTDIQSLRTNLSACCAQGMEAAKAVLPLTRG